MTTPSKLLLKITKNFQPHEERDGITYVVVKRAYGHLLREMERVFEKEQNVRVILEGRNGDRRKSLAAIGEDRRHRDRRGRREEMIEIILSD